MDFELRQSLINTRRTIEGLLTDIDNIIRINERRNSHNFNINYIPPPSYLSSNFYRYPYLNYLNTPISNSFYNNPGFNSYFTNLYNTSNTGVTNYSDTYINTNNTDNTDSNTDNNTRRNYNPNDYLYTGNTTPSENIYSNALDLSTNNTTNTDNTTNTTNTNTNTNTTDTTTDNTTNATTRDFTLNNMNESLNQTYREFQRIVNNQRNRTQEINNILNNSTSLDSNNDSTNENESQSNTDESNIIRGSTTIERRNAIRVPNIRRNQDIRRRIRRILPELVEITLYNGGSTIKFQK